MRLRLKVEKRHLRWMRLGDWLLMLIVACGLAFFYLVMKAQGLPTPLPS